MKTRPILFSAPMVRALISGDKTQTRRIVKPQPEFRHNCFFDPGSSTGYGIGLFSMQCPYGQPGDRIWVRETWNGPFWPDNDPLPENGYTPKYCEYRADGGDSPWYADSDGHIHEGWLPSIHMPRWASRITLEVTGVRVERLQDISEADAMAEGVIPEATDEAINAYMHLWEGINGVGSWDANPWVWVIEFKRVTS